MRRTACAALLIAALALAACGYAVANPSPPATAVATSDPEGAIAAAVTLHLSRQGIAKLTQANVEVERVEGGAARARVLPEDPAATDPAWVFLKLQDGLWTVVAGPGTAFTPEDMQAAGLPESLLPANP
ncbi:MAG TPA: hypothetical protein VNL77_22875 [Roseiflexaceae bacterium]|nr:hypothetical protein [Roseiflexaceae bacterium]